MSYNSQDLISMQRRSVRGGPKFVTLDPEGLALQSEEIRKARQDIIRNRKKVTGSKYPRRGAPGKKNKPILAWQDKSSENGGVDLTITSVEAAELDNERRVRDERSAHRPHKRVPKNVDSLDKNNRKAFLEDLRALRQEHELNTQYLSHLYKEMHHQEELIGINNSPKKNKHDSGDGHAFSSDESSKPRPVRNLRAELLQNLIRTREHEDKILSSVMKQKTLADQEILDEALAERHDEISRFVHEKRQKYLPSTYLDDLLEEEQEDEVKTSSDSPSSRKSPQRHHKKHKQPRGFVRQEARQHLSDRTAKIAQEVENRRLLKELEDEKEMAKRFHAKPIPPSTLEPRYKQLIELDEARRLSNHIARKERLQHDERPFEGMIRREKERAIKRAKKAAERERLKQIEEEKRRIKRQERANRAASYSSGGVTYKQMMEEEEAKRKANMAKRSDMLRKSAHMPQRMEMHLLEEQHKKQQQRSVARIVAQHDAGMKKKKKHTRRINVNKTSLSEIEAKQKVRREMRRQEREEFWRTSSKLPGQMELMEEYRQKKRQEKERKRREREEAKREVERSKREKMKRESKKLRDLAYADVKVRTTEKVRAYDDFKMAQKEKEEEARQKKNYGGEKAGETKEGSLGKHEAQKSYTTND